mmetsp:Transcript_16354/g.30347  ORF Transcript_16354/g.30347 Transcript_16354/m.30347 type:complete len:266 (+) Transcript_16354:642-1439(+)
MGSPSTVGIDNDFTACQTGVTVRSTNDEATRGVQVVDGVVIQILFGDDRLDDVFHEVTLDLFVGDFLRVLARDDDGVDTNRHGDAVLQLVLAGDLSLGIGADPVASSVLANLGDLGSKLGGQHVCQGHQGLGFVRGVTKHDTLITGTKVFHLLCVNGLGNIGRLLLNGNNNVAGLVVETLGRVVVTNVLDGITDNLFVVDSGGGGNFSENHDHTGLAAGFASNTGGFVSSKARIQDGVRHLIGKLVRVSFIDRFGSEKESRHVDE